MRAVTALEGSFMLKMKRKTLFYTLFLPILLLNLSSIEIRAEGHEAVSRAICGWLRGTSAL